MPDSRMIYKAGKLSFLLVCLFLYTACGKNHAVFEAGTMPLFVTSVEELREERPIEVSAEAFPTEEIEKEQTDTGENETEKEASVTKKVNVNTADAQELMTLPGIGERRAQAIIQYRECVGVFRKEEDLMNVKGIGTGIFKKINSLICVK